MILDASAGVGKSASRFNGQWALAIWDRTREREVVLSRDRLGIRPLYYTSVGESLLFASEVKALFCHPGVQRRFDPVGNRPDVHLLVPRRAPDSVRRSPPAPSRYADVVDTQREAAAAQYWTYDYGTDTRVPCRIRR